jgi:phosphoenolpyruvate carboxykinase (ATP)
VKGVAEQSIAWTGDDDFEYEIATDVPGFDDVELLQPRRLYERQGRLDEYNQMVARLKSERTDRLHEFPELSEQIVDAVS